MFRGSRLLIAAWLLMATGCATPEIPIAAPAPTAEVAAAESPSPSPTQAPAPLADGNLRPPVAMPGDAESTSPTPFSTAEPDGRPRSMFAAPTHLPGYAETQGKRNPLPSTSIYLDRGRKLYVEACVQCHGANGAGDVANASAMGVRMRDLRDASAYKYGSSDADIFRSIAFGIPGTAMGALHGVMTEDDVWSLVHYVRSL
jgi:mono/diheme cytochrome c family protein